MKYRSICLLAVAAWLLSPAAALAAPAVGQVDNFEDGTVQGWLINLLGFGGGATPPANISTGGPAGAGDNYLQLTALGGSGAGSRLVAINQDARWAGNYVAAGVGAITMDVNNLGATELSLRMLFESAAGGPPTDTAFSTDPVVVPAGSGWVPVTFPIAPGDLTAGVGSVNDALTGATVIRLFHSSTAVFPGDPIAATLGVDNITAAVPEPASLTWLALGLVGLATKARRRSSR